MCIWNYTHTYTHFHVVRGASGRRSGRRSERQQDIGIGRGTSGRFSRGNWTEIGDFPAINYNKPRFRWGLSYVCHVFWQGKRVPMKTWRIQDELSTEGWLLITLRSTTFWTSLGKPGDLENRRVFSQEILSQWTTWIQSTKTPLGLAMGGYMMLLYCDWG